MKNDVIYLITTEETFDTDGFPIVEESKTMVMGEIKSVSYNEFYKASEIGMKVDLIASINDIDYDLAGKPIFAEFDSVRYKIVRTYRIKKNNSIELTLSEVE